MSGQGTDADVIVGGDRPTKELSETIAGVCVVQTVQAAILNLDDPDVKVLHSWLPSTGGDHAEICRRGREKARYSWRDVPQSLTPSAASWARLLRAFPGTELTINRQRMPHWLGREGDWEGWAHPEDGVSVSFHTDGSARILVNDDGQGAPLSVASEVRGSAMKRFDLKAFIHDARLRLRKARKRLQEIESLGVDIEE